MTDALSTSAGACLRHPRLHGDLVAFVTEDDLWLAPLDGGAAARPPRGLGRMRGCS
ncbi:hypothetical protein ABTY61_14890 [Kitasatospora sp. NPDC096128]|uniref:hypothetical protein n=1 Tax=Kitasatospora sp. NPDC096128 TaxID=3155547 RepID=UPI00332FB5F6